MERLSSPEPVVLAGRRLRAWSDVAWSKLKPTAAPAALLATLLHIMLTISSWRYTASTLLVIDMSPSMCLASLALLVFWTSPASPPAITGPAGSGSVVLGATSAGGAHDRHAAAPTAPAEASRSGRHTSAGGAGPAGALRRVLRKLAQAVLPSNVPSSAPRGDSLAAVSLLQRHKQARASMDGSHGSSSPYSSSPSSSSGMLGIAGGAPGGCVSWRQRLRDTRWQPSMSRIMSGQKLHLLETESSASSISTSTASRRRDNGAHAQGGGQARHTPFAGVRPRPLGGVRGRGGHHTGGGDSSHHTGGGPLGGSHHSGSSAHRHDLPLVPHSGHLAVDCVRHDTTHAGSLPDLEGVVTPQHLLQFGALLGESSAELALSQAGSEGALGCSPHCLFGAADDEAHWARGWEPLADESCARRGLHYQAWRRYLRKGLFMYKSRTVFEGVTPVQCAAFYFDVRHKVEWDESCTAMTAIPPPSLAATAGGWSEAEHAFARSAFLYARTRFPTPMVQREYIYARRVWAKADDGGCYVVGKATQAHPAPPPPGCRVVRVQDFASGTVIRESSHGSSARGPCSEMVTVYFEDANVASGILNLGIRKALWPMVQKLDAAMRARLATPTAVPGQVATAAVLQDACLRSLAAAAAAAVALAGAPDSPSMLAALPGLPAAAATARPPLRRCASANSTTLSPSSSSSGTGGIATAAGAAPAAVLASPVVPAASVAGATAVGLLTGAMPELHVSASTPLLLEAPLRSGGGGGSGARMMRHSFSAHCASSSVGTPLVSMPLCLPDHTWDDGDGDSGGDSLDGGPQLTPQMDWLGGGGSGAGGGAVLGVPASGCASAMAMIPPGLRETFTLSWARPSVLANGAAAAGAAPVLASPEPLALAVLRHSMRGPALVLDAALLLLLDTLRVVCAAAALAWRMLAQGAHAAAACVCTAAAAAAAAAALALARAHGPGAAGATMMAAGAPGGVASHPVEVEPPADPHPLLPQPLLPPCLPQPQQPWPAAVRGSSKGPRSLAARLALVAVRAVTLPLAYKVLSHSSAAGHSQEEQQRGGGAGRPAWGEGGGGSGAGSDRPSSAVAAAAVASQPPQHHAPPQRRASVLSRSDSLGSHATSLVVQHGGRQGSAAGTQASWRESEARVRHWLDPVSAPEYLLGQHAELLQQHMALQQLQERSHQQQQQVTRLAAPLHKRGLSMGAGIAATAAPSGAQGGSNGARPHLHALVVDGVALTWDRCPAHGTLAAGGQRAAGGKARPL